MNTLRTFIYSKLCGLVRINFPVYVYTVVTEQVYAPKKMKYPTVILSATLLQGVFQLWACLKTIGRLKIFTFHRMVFSKVLKDGCYQGSSRNL